MELVCVRHGRTAWNAARRFQGRTDVPLDATGVAQARALAAHLRGERFEVAITSDLGRAAATADAIGAACGISVERDGRLREMQFGVWEGKTWPEIVAASPELDDRHATSPRSYVPDGGETFEAVCARAAAVLADVVRRLRPDGRALIVSHAGVMHALVRVALDEPDEAALGITFVPASIMRLSGDGRPPWQMTAVNETAPDAGALAETPSAAP